MNLNICIPHGKFNGLTWDFIFKRKKIGCVILFPNISFNSKSLICLAFVRLSKNEI